jgi:hypothetical protein
MPPSRVIPSELSLQDQSAATRANAGCTQICKSIGKDNAEIQRNTQSEAQRDHVDVGTLAKNAEYSRGTRGLWRACSTHNEKNTDGDRRKHR